MRRPVENEANNESSEIHRSYSVHHHKRKRNAKTKRGKEIPTIPQACIKENIDKGDTPKLQTIILLPQLHFVEVRYSPQFSLRQLCLLRQP